MRRLLHWVPSVVVIVPWLLAPAFGPSNEMRVRDLSGAVSFRLLDWETLHVGERAGRLWTGLFGAQTPGDADVTRVRDYFRGSGPDRPDRASVEVSLERLVANAYEQHGVQRSEPLPTDHLFPPVLVALTPPPNLLVIAPRTDLRVLSSVVLNALDVPAQERLEASADSNGVSSLVAPIGGLATYPSMILEEDVPERVMTSVAHEWLHQYLIFYPLGAGYWERQETREINETTAELVGQEIGSQLSAQYRLQRPAPSSSGGQPTFDFRAFMRETRRQTEQLLGSEQIDAAEAYMRTRRDELQQHGYAIRKINQAYFALYGSYGGGFAASPSNPILDLLRQLRERSASLADFIFQVRGITSVTELRATLAQTEQRGFIASAR